MPPVKVHSHTRRLVVPVPEALFTFLEGHARPHNLTVQELVRLMLLETWRRAGSPTVPQPPPSATPWDRGERR